MKRFIILQRFRIEYKQELIVKMLTWIEINITHNLEITSMLKQIELSSLTYTLDWQRNYLNKPHYNSAVVYD